MLGCLTTEAGLMNIVKVLDLVSEDGYKRLMGRRSAGQLTSIEMGPAPLCSCREFWLPASRVQSSWCRATSNRRGASAVPVSSAMAALGQLNTSCARSGRLRFCRTLPLAPITR